MITVDILKKIAPAGNTMIMTEVAKHLNTYLPKYGIDTYLRICHFLAQAAHETDQFKTLTEYWGPTAAQRGYEGRDDLGNKQKGDGKRFLGRGIFQVTGRYNYGNLGKKLGVDLENNPEKAADPEISVRAACEYWNSKGISAFADKDDVLTVTRRINGGTNGLADRKLRLQLAKANVPKNIDLTPPAKTDAPASQPALNFNISVAKKGDKSDYIKDLQNMLVKKGFVVGVDGIFGDETEKAVKSFQTKNNLDSTGIIDTNTLLKLMAIV